MRLLYKILKNTLCSYNNFSMRRFLIKKLLDKTILFGTYELQQSPKGELIKNLFNRGSLINTNSLV